MMRLKNIKIILALALYKNYSASGDELTPTERTGIISNIQYCGYMVCVYPFEIMAYYIRMAAYSFVNLFYDFDGAFRTRDEQIEQLTQAIEASKTNTSGKDAEIKELQSKSQELSQLQNEFEQSTARIKELEGMLEDQDETEKVTKRMIEELQTHKAQDQTKIAELEELIEIQREIAGNADSVKVLEHKSAQLKQESEKYTLRIKELENELRQLKTVLTEQKERIKTLEQEVANANEDSAQAHSMIKRLEEEKETKEQESAQLLERIAKRNAEIEDLCAKHRAEVEELKEADRKRQEITIQRIDDIRTKMAESRGKEAETIAQRIEARKARLEILKATYAPEMSKDSIPEENEAIQLEVQAAIKQRDALSLEIQESIAEIEALKAQKEAVQAELQTLKTESHELNQKIKDLLKSAQQAKEDQKIVSSQTETMVKHQQEFSVGIQNMKQNLADLATELKSRNSMLLGRTKQSPRKQSLTLPLEIVTNTASNMGGQSTPKTPGPVTPPNRPSTGASSPSSQQKTPNEKSSHGLRVPTTPPRMPTHPSTASSPHVGRTPQSQTKQSSCVSNSAGSRTPNLGTRPRMPTHPSTASSPHVGRTPQSQVGQRTTNRKRLPEWNPSTSLTPNSDTYASASFGSQSGQTKPLGSRAQPVTRDQQENEVPSGLTEQDSEFGSVRDRIKSIQEKGRGLPQKPLQPLSEHRWK